MPLSRVCDGSIHHVEGAAGVGWCFEEEDVQNTLDALGDGIEPSVDVGHHSFFQRLPEFCELHLCFFC